jgi:regulatory protein
MKITKIEKQQKNEKRFSIFIDDVFAFGIEDIDIINYKLKVGDELTKSKYEDIYNNALVQKAKNRAYYFISYKSRTKKEIIDKLKKDYTQDVVQEVIKILERYKYIDDFEYAKLYIKEKTNLKGYGKTRLKYELKAKGVLDETIDKVLDEYELDEVTIAIKLINKKTKGNKNLEFKGKKRLFDFLYRRGFDYQTINEAYKTYIENFD